MTPIPPLSQHIASWLLPGDRQFPPRFALVLTPVANGAAVKATAVTTIKHWTVLSNFCARLSALWDRERRFLSENKTGGGDPLVRKVPLSGAIISHSGGGEGTQIRI